MKKLFALLLAVIMVLSMAACAPQGDPTTEATKPQAQATDPKPQQSTAAPTEGDKPYAGELPLVTEKVTMTIGIPMSANTVDYETNEFTLWVEEQTGIDLKFQVFSSDATERKQQVAAMISGNEKLPDIMWGMGLGDTLCLEYGQDGYFLDIAPYWDENNYYWEKALYEDFPDNVMDQDLKEYCDMMMVALATDPSTGAMYNFPTMQCNNSDSDCGQFITINKDWLDLVGLENPKTVDELYEVLKAFKNTDCNGNGKNDELPAVWYPNGYHTDWDQWVINAYVYMNEDYHFNATDGKIWVPYNTDEYRQALITLNKWYAEGLIAPVTYAITSNAELTAIWTPADKVPVAGVIGGHSTLHTEANNEALFSYVVANVLEGETELGGYANYNGPDIRTGSITIAGDTENPELAVRLVDFLVGTEAATFARFGKKGVHWDDPPAGSVNALGDPAGMEAAEDWKNIYGSQNNVIWHNGELGMIDFATYCDAVEDDGSWANYRTKYISYAVGKVYREGPHMEETVWKIPYNAEETEVIGDVKGGLTSYIKEARGLFITGNMDPNSDADWETYLKNLKAEGLEEWIAATQTAYTRLNQG